MGFWKKDLKADDPQVTVRKSSIPDAVVTRIIAQEISAQISENLKLVPSNYQHIGDRENQEDSFAISDLSGGRLEYSSPVLAVLADGMGGLALGEEASQLAVDKFMHEFENGAPGNSVDDCLRQSLLSANAAVYDLACGGGRREDIGTTLVATAIVGEELYWIAAGDSRIYLLTDGKMKQLNLDHIYANHLAQDVEKGRITLKEAQDHPEKDYLTSYLGLPRLSEISQGNKPVKLKPGEKILLCSDGLTNTLTEKQISAILQSQLENTAEVIVREVLMANKAHQDNVTVIVLSIYKV